MKEYISFDGHKQYTLAEREEVETGKTRHCRIEHARGAIRNFLAGRCERGTPVAVEATGNWYWIVEEIEEAGLQPKLVHPRKTKLMMGLLNKTDKLDVHGLNLLQRNGTLPTVWIPPGEFRDVRELTRTRLVVVRHRTRLKNRIQATLAKYALSVEGFSDSFGQGTRKVLEERVGQLPSETEYATRLLMAQLDFVHRQVNELEDRLKELVKMTPEMRLLMALPGVAEILATTIALEIGEVGRFPSAQHLVSYAGTTPRVHASGDKVRYGRSRPDVSRYLKWVYVEAANWVALNHRRRAERHVSRLYGRICKRRGHQKAIGAVARHLAEACFDVLSKEQPYRDRALTRGRAREA